MKAPFKLALFGCLACTLVLGTAHAQTDPTTKLQPDHWYVNGQPSTKEAVEALARKKAIRRLDTFTGKQAVAHSHDTSSKKVVLVTTK